MAEQYTLMEDVYKKSLSERYADYDVYGSEREIHKVVIDGNVFSGYKTFTFIWEKSYTKEPERSSNGTIGNLNSYPTFITPHLKINFAMISIDDYRRFYRLMLQKNEFTVTCYDIVNDKRITKKMYFAPDQFPTLYTVARKLTSGEKFIELTGVKDYTVELIGTNNELDLVSVTYLPNYPEGQTPPSASEGENDFYIGEEVVIGKNSTYPNKAPNNYTFSHWQDQDGANYSNGAIIAIDKELILKAIWQPSTTKVLSFDYGVSQVVYDSNGQEILTKEVTQGKAIGELPSPVIPKVTVNGKEYNAYENGEWWRTTVKVSGKENEFRVYSSTQYWSSRNDTIHWLVDKIPYTITFVTNMDGYSVSTATYGYQDTVILPNLGKAGKTFIGWFTDDKYTAKFNSGSGMPPYHITLYAKWE